MTDGPLFRAMVLGPAVGGGQSRMGRTRDGRRPVYYKAKPQVDYQRLAVDTFRAAWGQDPLDGPVAVSIQIAVARPLNLRRPSSRPDPMWATCKPDLDNAQKLLLDALTQAGVIVDDVQVARVRVERWYLGLSAHRDPDRPSLLLHIGHPGVLVEAHQLLPIGRTPQPPTLQPRRE